MDTPSRFQTVSLVCKCGASLTHTDFAFRVGVAEEEFRAQHQTDFCGVTAPCGRCCQQGWILQGRRISCPDCEGSGEISRTKKGED